jgi:hypothetical protein
MGLQNYRSEGHSQPRNHSTVERTYVERADKRAPARPAGPGRGHRARIELSRIELSRFPQHPGDDRLADAAAGVAGLGVATVWPLATRAEQPEGKRRIGVLMEWDEKLCSVAH